MSTENNSKMKSLEEILAEIINNADEPEMPHYDEAAWQRVIKIVDALAEKGKLVQEICSAEPDFITDNPFLIRGPYLRQEFVEKLFAALLEIEEIIYIHSNATTYEPFEISRYMSANRKKCADPVDIHISDHSILIKMPYLPKRYGGAKDLCNQLLAAKLFHTHDLPVWPKWTANYYHVFPTNVCDIPKDVDNYEYKRTNDILGFALGTCDNALRFSMSMTTVFTDEIDPGTYIEIIPKSSENIDFLISEFGGSSL